VGVTLLSVELDKLKSTSTASTLNLEECWRSILEQSFLEFLITFINAFVPLRWLPLPANWKYRRAADDIWTTARELTEKNFEEVETRQAMGLTGEEDESRDLLIYMIEANLSSPEDALTREQIIEDASYRFQTGYHSKLMIADIAIHPRWLRIISNVVDMDNI